MADYRRKLSKEDHKNIVRKYKKHRDASGGIFVSRTRRRLLGIKDEKSGLFREDTSDFWLDVRSNVKTALTDLQLICEVANQDQLKEMFSVIPCSSRKSDPTKASLSNVIETLFYTLIQYKRDKDGLKPIFDQKNIPWKAELSNEIVQKCLEFYSINGMITSKAHERLVMEVTDMLGSELSHTLSRELKLSYYAKFH